MVTIKELREKCKKPYWGPMHKLYHEIGFYFTLPFVNTRVTPNQITILWMTIQIIGAVLLSFGTYWHMLIGILIYHLGFFVDCVDGNLARYRKKSSWTGIYLEQIVHHITITALLIGLTVGVFRMYPNYLIIFFGFIGTISFLFDKVFGINVGHFRAHAAQSKMEYDEEVSKMFKKGNLKYKHKFITSVFAFLRVEHPLNLLFFLLLFGLPHVALVLYSVLFFLEMLRKLVANIRHLRKTDKKYD